MMKIASGTLLTADNQIDQSTGTSRLKAFFNNTDNALFPNQFVNVHLLLESSRTPQSLPRQRSSEDRKARTCTLWMPTRRRTSAWSR